MQNLQGKSIAVLATNGFEQSELEVPRDKLREAGATVHVISLEPGQIKGWDKDDWGRAVDVDKTLESVSADDYDAICCGLNKRPSISSANSGPTRKSSPPSATPLGCLSKRASQRAAR